MRDKLTKRAPGRYGRAGHLERHASPGLALSPTRLMMSPARLMTGA